MSGDTNAQKYAFIARGEQGIESRIVKVYINAAAGQDGRNAMLPKLFADLGPGCLLDIDMPDEDAKAKVETKYFHGELGLDDAA